MHDRLDSAIDEAVREMLDVEPPADLRARVLSQLPPDGSPLPACGIPPSLKLRRASRLPAFGWVLAPAAIIVIAVVVTRRSDTPPQAPVVARHADVHLMAPAVAPVVRRPDVIPASVTRRALVARATTAPAVVAATVAADEGFSTSIAPLRHLSPITIAAIGEHNIAPAEIAVRPLNAIADVQIAPLTPPDGR